MIATRQVREDWQAQEFGLSFAQTHNDIIPFSSPENFKAAAQITLPP